MEKVGEKNVTKKKRESHLVSNGIDDIQVWHLEKLKYKVLLSLHF